MNELEKKNELIGLTYEEAKQFNYDMRVYCEDGENYMLTMDFKPNRINVEITNGLITNLHLG